MYLDLYTSLQRSCCNPYLLHTNLVKKNLRVINIAQAKATGKTSVKAGMKMCIKCRSHKPIPEDDMQESDTDFVAVENVREHLDQSFTANGLSPCKLPKISSRDKEGYIKRKVKQVEEKQKTFYVRLLEYHQNHLTYTLRLQVYHLFQRAM